MATKILRSIKGRAARFTRLDQCGNIVYGPSSVVVTHGFITVTVGLEYETGEEISQKNAWGENEIDEKDPDFAKWANVGVQLSEVHPDVLDITGGATPVVVGDDTIGWTFGPNATTGAFALEVWTKKAGRDACAPDGTLEWGYFVVPFIKNGKLDGDLTIANAPLNVGIAGEGYGAPEFWGIGPHLDNPFLATAGFPVGEYFGGVVTTVGPPAVTDGVAELFGPVAEVEPGDVYLGSHFPTITAQDSTRAALLAGLGFVPADPAAWATGEFFAIGAFHFNWSGSAWAAGPHA